MRTTTKKVESSRTAGEYDAKIKKIVKKGHNRKPRYWEEGEDKRCMGRSVV